jgi:predicted dehydrogenase
MTPLKLALIGAGNRGRGLASLALKSGQPVEISALADPSQSSRKLAEDALGVPPDRQFTSCAQLLDQCPDLDAAIVATDVRSHAQTACRCLEKGLPIYLEKPMTRTIDEAHQVVRTSRETGVPVMVGFNLRYSPFYRRLKEVVQSGVAGQVISIEWKEILSPHAWADGYSRAGWYTQQDQMGGWLLEKSCHDIDLINWLVDAPCSRVSSFGSRKHFVPRDDVPLRCTDGCPIESECYFSCYKLHPDGPASTPSYVGPERWDLCVYHSGADLRDRQVAIMEYENGVTASFSIVPVGYRWERVMRICGTEATINGSDFDCEINVCRHDASQPTVETLPKTPEGHGGADPAIIKAFLDYMADRSRELPVSLDAALEAMLVAGGIELACDDKRVLELAQLREQPQPLT